MALTVFELQVAFLFLLGLAFGSFGNVILYRVPRLQSMRGRSQCPFCATELRVWQLIPLLSFLLLGGKCHRCKNSISLQYPLVELASGILFIAGILLAPSSLFLAIAWGMCFWLLLLIAIIDARTASISDILNIPFLILAGVVSIASGHFGWLALGVGLGFIGLQWIVSKGRWVGSGDVLLIAGISMLLPGWAYVTLCLLLAYIFGAGVAFFLLSIGEKTKKDHLAFAPFLGMACLTSLFFGETILALYVPI